MCQIHCTQKLLKEIGEDDLHHFNYHQNSLIGNWYANIFKVGRYKNLIFINEKTLFSFIILRTKQKEFQNLHEVFINGLKNALYFINIDANTINQIILEYNGNINLANTDNRKIIGNMNNLVYLYKHIMEYDHEINKIVIKANNMPQRNLKWSSSTEALYKIIES